jgi:hypothetical protein
MVVTGFASRLLSLQNLVDPAPLANISYMMQNTSGTETSYGSGLRTFHVNEYGMNANTAFSNFVLHGSILM